MGKAIGLGNNATGGVGPTPADVTLGVGSYRYTQPEAQSTRLRRQALELTVPWTPPDPWSGVGVNAWYEYPDGSMGGGEDVFTLDGESALDGETPLVGEFKPQYGGKFKLAEDGNNKITIPNLPVPKEQVSIRVYATPYTEIRDNDLVRATLEDPTPSVVIVVDPPDIFGRGEEYVKNVTDLVVDDQYDGTLPGQPGIPSVPGGSRTYYLAGGAGQLTLHLNVNWTNPDDPRYGGVQLFIIRADANVYPLSRGTVISPAYNVTVKVDPFPSAPEVVRVFALSVSGDGLVNSYIRGVTPEVELTLQPPTVGNLGGVEYTQLVTALTS